jgi:phosphate:Na+ symporter
VTIAGALNFLGGIGLFLLGMRLMTDGLTTAAGDTLRVILSAATRSRGRAIFSGILITALVQSSTAVVFTTIGFVNASLLALPQAVGVIFGSNLGTTLTSWIVALIGFNLDLQVIALPAIGIGMAISVALGKGQYGALGRAMAGFGLFFMGIDVLKDAFDGIGDVIDLHRWAGEGVLNLLLFVLLGIMLTVIIHSSSAALTVILTATAGGLIPLTAAAAMVIGANVGTTSTALFAVFDATAAARRAAMSHVIFNLVVALVSFTLLLPLLGVVHVMAQVIGSQDQLAMSLAIFHTLVNILGILVMWPLTPRLVAYLETRFRTLEEDESRPRFMDRNVQSAPSLALDALAQELHRMQAIARRVANAAISAEDPHNPSLEIGHRALESLNIAISEFASGIPRATMSAEQQNALPHAQRVGQYLVNVAEHAREMLQLHHESVLAPESALAVSRNALRASAVELLDLTRVDSPQWDAQRLAEARRDFETQYQAMKAQLLQAGTAGAILPRSMAETLERLSDLHRVVDQAAKAAVFLDRYIAESKVQLVSPPGGIEETAAQGARASTLPQQAQAQDSRASTLPQDPLSPDDAAQDAAPPAGDLR